MTLNQFAFLDMIATSELGQDLIDLSDDGYNVIVGSTLAHPHLFTDYSDHPRVFVHLSPTLTSSAAGRYQILARYFDIYKKQLNLPNFGPDSQDTIALQMIHECDALDDIEAGNIISAIAKCTSRWASLPGSTYGQHTNQLASLTTAYVQAGGILTA